MHIGTHDPKEIIAFTTHTLEFCHKKQDIRNRTQMKTKYDMILPLEPDGVAGYHSKCYRYFCAIAEKPESQDEREIIFLKHFPLG